MAEQAQFIERTRCIACDSDRLETTDSGSFADEPHRSSLLHGIWGQSPFPYLKDCRWEIVRCRDCGQVFHKRILAPEWDERRHTEWMTKDAIDRFEEQHGVNLPSTVFDRARGEVTHLLSMERMTRSLRSSGEAVRLLDFGCGWGRLVTLASLFGFDAVGVDRSNARRSGQRGGLGTIFASLDEYTASKPKPLHVVTLQQVLEHVTTPMPILRALHALMAPSAVLLLEVPDAGHVTKLRTPEDLVADGLDHINAFSAATLRGMAERAGFRPVTPDIAHVTADIASVAKREVKRVVRHVIAPTTQQYFRRA